MTLKQALAEARALLEDSASGTIRIKNQDYTWETTTDSKGAKQYILKGKKGADYITMRNAHHPELLFVVSRRAFGTPQNMKGVWLTDKNGTLETSKEVIK